MDERPNALTIIGFLLDKSATPSVFMIGGCVDAPQTAVIFDCCLVPFSNKNGCSTCAACWNRIDVPLRYTL